jgi:hypothetical protein
MVHKYLMKKGEDPEKPAGCKGIAQSCSFPTCIHGSLMPELSHSPIIPLPSFAELCFLSKSNGAASELQQHVAALCLCA